MEKLIGSEKIRIAVFISGTGSNLYNLIRYSKLRNSNFSILFVFSNNKNAKGLSYAKKFKIQFKVLNFKEKKYSENQLLKHLKAKKIQIICLAGFMKILSSNFIQKFDGKIINIHPSLLPKYKGLNTHQRVLDNCESYSGCTVHYVNTKLDSGKIILQKRVKVYKKDNAVSLAKRVLKQEHKIYPLALKKVISSL